MSDPNALNDPDDIRDQAGLTPPERRILQAKADKAEELQAELDQMRRTVAVKDAGLGDLTAKQLKAIEATHEGEWTPDALKASAAELGIIAAPPPPPPSVPSDEMAGQRRMNGAAVGADSTPPNPESEFEAAIAQLRGDVDAGRLSPEKASEQFDRMYRAQHPDRMSNH